MSRRGHHMSTKVPNVKLKPVPKNGRYPRDDGITAYDPHATSGTARDALKDDKRPFAGLQLCCTGMKDKASLFGKARELGALCSNDLTDLTTHLVADAPGSAKYNCAVNLGIPVMTSDWILDTHTRWLAGLDIDFEECVSEHLLPPLKGVVICTTRLTNNEDRQRITKSAVRLGAAYQAHLNKAVTHLLIGPDDGSNVDSQKLQWVKQMNKKRRTEPSDEPEPLIHVVWDSWLLHCAVAGSIVSEDEFIFSENGQRPDPPEDIERWLKKSSSKKPATVYVTASSVGAGGSGGSGAPGGKERLEKARVRKLAVAGTMWNTILSSSQNAQDPDSFVPPTQMQQRKVPPSSTPPRSTSPIVPSSAPPPVIDLDDSATEDEEESLPNKASTSRAAGPKSSVMAAPDPPTPIIQTTAPRNLNLLGNGKTTSMVSRLNSLRGSAFQIGPNDQGAPGSSSRSLARVVSIRQDQAAADAEMAPVPPATASPKVFAGKRIAPVGEARKGSMLYVALRTHGAIVIGEPDESDPKGKGKAKDDDSATALPEEEVDFYIVRLSGEMAKKSRELDCYDKFRTDCWVEHCIFEDRLCSPTENITYAPLKIQLPVPGTESIQLHWTGLNNEQETAAKRLVKVLGINVTESFLRRVNTHLVCGSKSGLKYEKALQWKIALVDMDWLYAIAREGRIPATDGAQANDLPGNDTTAGPSVIGTTIPLVTTTSKDVNSRSSPFLGAPNGLLGVRAPSVELASTQPENPVQPERNSSKGDVPPSSGQSSSNAKSGSANQPKEAEPDRVREREAHRNQLADSLGALLKHQLDENPQTEQPRKRARPLQRQKGNGVETGSTSRTRSLSEKVSTMSLQTRVSDLEYVSPLEAIEPVQEETLQVHYLDPNQHAAKEGLLKLFEGSSQFPEAEVLDLATQTESELTPPPPPPPKATATRRKRGGAAAATAGSSGRRKSQRRA